VKGRITWAFLAATVIPLLFVYFSFLYWWYQNPRFFPDTTVETIILTTQAARAIVVLAVPRFRRAGFLSIIDIFTIEILSVPVFIVLSLEFGRSLFLTIAGQIIWAWPPAFIITFLPISIYKLASKMYHEPPLSLTVPSVVAIFVTLALLLTSTASFTTADGLMGLSKLLVATIFGSLLSPTTPFQVSSVGVALFFVLSVYAVTQGRGAPINRGAILVLALLGVVAAIGWTLVATSFTASYLWVFGLPALAMLGIVWGITRGR
jgi:hypothetical protein